jgi:hypothetical protein
MEIVALFETNTFDLVQVKVYIMQIWSYECKLLEGREEQKGEFFFRI